MARRSQIIDGWTVHEFDSVDSTNLVAARFPIWQAVRADTQTAGRGRFQRTWISDAGGLWLSAVVPPQTGLPLLVGLAICEALSELGVANIRLRWPNDVLIHERKLAGLLLDQFTADRVVVGIGLNVHNRPEMTDATLAKQATRLADLISAAPGISELTGIVLRHLRRVVTEAGPNDFSSVLPRINALWGAPRRVELDLDGELRRGEFSRVDGAGRLVLRDDSGVISSYAPAQVRHLQELP